MLDLLDAAIGAMLIRELPQRPGDCRSPTRSSSARSTRTSGSTRRQRLHRRIAVALEALCGDDPGDRLGELAYHWAQASQPVDADQAIDYALRAGDHALAKLAPDDAVASYQPGPRAHRRPTRSPASLRAARRWSASAPRSVKPSIRASRETLLAASDLAERLGDAGCWCAPLWRTTAAGPAVPARSTTTASHALEAALTATAGTETPERATAARDPGGRAHLGRPRPGPDAQ